MLPPAGVTANFRVANMRHHSLLRSYSKYTNEHISIFFPNQINAPLVTIRDFFFPIEISKKVLRYKSVIRHEPSQSATQFPVESQYYKL